MSEAVDEIAPRRGRKPGVPNRITSELRALIQRRGRPIELLCDVARGRKIRIGPQAGLAEAKFVYPDLETRIAVALRLVNKLAPDMRAEEISGPDGEPLAAITTVPDKEIARRLLLMLHNVDPGDPLSPPLRSSSLAAATRSVPMPDRAHLARAKGK